MQTMQTMQTSYTVFRQKRRPLLTILSAVMLVLILFVVPACSKAKADSAETAYQQERSRMVERQLVSRGLSNQNVLAAMRSVKRHLFVPESKRRLAYEDHPLPIGSGQTISQPYIVAFMTEQLDPEKDDRILEVGTGSGYQAAILAEIVEHVYSIEIVESLALEAKEKLASLGYSNVTVKHGDGYKGWDKYAPFDGIIVTCAPDHIPKPLIQQLKVGGKMVIPVGSGYQQIQLIRKTPSGIQKKAVLPVRFVPMTGEAEKKD